jgi:hypothetical protein
MGINVSRPEEIGVGKSKTTAVFQKLVLSGGLLFFSLACSISISWIPAPAVVQPTQAGQTDCSSRSSPAAPTPSAIPTTFPSVSLIMNVYADQEWQNTGVTIPSGRKFTVTFLSGVIHDDGVLIYDGNGFDIPCGEEGCCLILQKVKRGALIGRVGRYLFFIGNGGSFVADSSGFLELRINECDNRLYGNKGSLQVKIVL